MGKLTLLNNDGQFLADSREISEMISKRHDHLIRDIDGYIAILTKSTEPKFGVSDFFIESNYQDSTGRTLKCYLITRKGCDMVANKMTGGKGVLFTATYVTQFEEMEKALKPSSPSYMVEDPIARAERWIEEQKEKERIQTKTLMLEQRVAEFEPKITYLDLILQCKDAVNITQIAKDYDLSGQSLNKILNKEKVQYKLNGQWLLYQPHLNKGYTKSKTIPITHKDGSETYKMETRWTQKGRLFIHEILKNQGIIANLDQ